MDVRCFPLGPLQTNCFVISTAGEAVVVDPGGPPARVTEFLKQKGLALGHILLTHLHCDHIYGVKALADATGARVLASSADEFLMETELGAGGFMGLPLVEPFGCEPLPPGPAVFLGQPCEALPTPGHTPGSLSFYFPEAKRIFVGDLLFYRSIGRTDFPGGDMQALRHSVLERVFPLPGETVVHPGHGQNTSVGDERLHNPFFADYGAL